MNYLFTYKKLNKSAKIVLLFLGLLGLNFSLLGKGQFIDPIEITCGDLIHDDNYNAINDYNKSLYNNSNNCNTNFSANFNAKDVEYYLKITQRQEVIIQLFNLEKDLDLFLYYMDSNGYPTTCAAPASRNNGSVSEKIKTTLNAGTYLIIVDAYRTDQLSSYNLEIDCRNIQTQDCCSDEVLSKNWLKTLIDDLCENNCSGQKIYCATYNGQPAIHITPWTTCTDGIGSVYDCSGNLLDQYGGIGGLRLSGTLVNIRLLWDSDECNTGGTCENIPSNCTQVNCIPNTPTTTENGDYSCIIDCSFNGDKTIKYWSINGQIINTSNRQLKFTARQSGRYVICCYYICNGQIYKCCMEVECPPLPEDDCCSDDPLNLHWLKDLIDDLCDHPCKGQKIYCATYNGQPAIHITPWTTCTDGIGSVYDCSGNLLDQYGGIGGLRLSGTLVNIRLLWDSDECNTGGTCENIPSNCTQVNCIPNTPTTTENGDYSCIIDCSFNGDKTIKYWSINGQIINTSNRQLKFTARQSGRYVICCYYICNGQIYKCCMEVECPPLPEDDCCSDDPLNLHWLKDLIDDLCDHPCKGQKIYCATYNGQPAIHITPWTTCTDGIGSVYDCSGNLLDQYGGIGGLRLSGTLVNIRLLWDSDECNTGGTCENIPSNCTQVNCIPNTPTTTENGDYSCIIDCSFNGDKTIKYWSINGQIINTSNRQLKFTARQSGRYVICCYYICNGQIYKCCMEVECPTLPEDDCCSDEVLSKNWLKTLIDDLCENNCSGQKIYCATYNGQPAIHITPWTTCTDGIGSVYDCSGNLLDQYGGIGGLRLSGTLVNIRLLWDSDDCESNECRLFDNFENYYGVGNISSENPSLWKKWSYNAIDGKISRDRARSGRQSMEINRNQFGKQDVVLRLGSLSTGTHRIAWDMYINSDDQAYFNVQQSESNLKSGGVFGITFKNTDRYYQGKWFNVELYVDLDRNKVVIYLDNRRVKISRDFYSSLGGINFYAILDAHFYIDNVCVQRVSTIPFTNNSTSRSSNNAKNLFSTNDAKKVESSSLTNRIVQDNETQNINLTNNNVQKDNQLTVYPNPSRGVSTVRLNLEKVQTIQLTIFNQTGQLVKTIHLDNVQFINEQLDLGNLPNGMYYLKANGNNLSLSQKLIIQK